MTTDTPRPDEQGHAPVETGLDAPIGGRSPATGDPIPLPPPEQDGDQPEPNPLLREGPDAPDAADIEDPQHQL